MFRHFRNFKSVQFPWTLYYGELTAGDDGEKLELFAQYFSNVFSSSSDWNPSCIDINTPDKIISSFDYSEERIKTILKNLDVSKSSGIGGIAGCFLKEKSSAVWHSLHQIFSKIQQTVTFPESWKLAVVTPVVKKGDKRAVENNRHPSHQRPLRDAFLLIYWNTARPYWTMSNMDFVDDAQLYDNYLFTWNIFTNLLNRVNLK